MAVGFRHTGKKNGEYQLLAVLPEKQVSKIEGLYYGVMGVGYFAILIGGICAFFIRRKRYTGWFLSFYYRLEKFYSEYGVWQKYSVERGYDTVDAIIAYGNENPIYFVNEFSNIHLTKEEVKKKEIKACHGLANINSGYGWDYTCYFTVCEYYVSDRVQAK